MSKALLAIDPGGEHCGMALFEPFDGEGSEAGWICARTWELDPEECKDSIVDWVSSGVATVVVEEFRLYPWLAKQQAFQQFEVVEVIGVIKWLCRVLKEEGQQVEVVMQGASIKEPTQKILRAKKVASRAKQDRSGGHAKDAELHGWHYIMRNED